MEYCIYQSIDQISALGSVLMYPKHYAVRSSKWCPGKITKSYPKKDNTQIKYAILNNDIPPPLIQGNEDDEDSNNNKINDIQINNLNRPNSLKLVIKDYQK